MCGIAGSVNTAIDYNTVCLLRHRGPDRQSMVEEQAGQSKVYFGHTRLSILDLSEAGDQPMYTDCGNYCIIFNGEIYNHLELRKKLSGVPFKGHSDTETILYYIRAFGIAGVKDFNGIFAFALLDKKEERLYLVRDHFGVKPLYYYFGEDKLIFSSELKTILNSGAYQKEINVSALNTFLSFRYIPAPQTIFKNINKLKAACYICYDLKSKFEEKSYWHTPQQINHQITEKEALDTYRFLLEQAVQRQLLSDVPVGLLLSGGVDSAVLGYLMAKHSTTRIQSFTVGFEGKGDFNETQYAQETAAYIGSEHFEVFIKKKEYLDIFDQSFYYVEEPIAEPTIPALYAVSKLTAQHVKVVLSGQGIDEPMAGYKRYYGEYLFARYKKLIPLIPIRLLGKIFPRNYILSRSANALQYTNDLDRFVGIFTLFTNDLKHEIYKDELKQYTEADQKHLFENAFALSDVTGGSLSRLLYVDTRVMLTDDLLLFNDKITMASSIENRVPYLDINLINFIESLPVHFKRQGKHGKYLHRKAVEQWIPQQIIQRKKRGFSTPVDQWFQAEFSQTLEDLISSANSFSSRYFHIPSLKKMLADHRAKKHNYKNELFMLFSLEIWHRNFYGRF